jgi:hypothetical protein
MRVPVAMGLLSIVLTSCGGEAPFPATPSASLASPTSTASPTTPPTPVPSPEPTAEPPRVSTLTLTPLSCFYFCSAGTCRGPVPEGAYGECWFDSNAFNSLSGMRCSGSVSGLCSGGQVAECDGLGDNVAIAFRAGAGPGRCTIRATVTNGRGDTADALQRVEIKEP